MTSTKIDLRMGSSFLSHEEQLALGELCNIYIEKNKLYEIRKNLVLKVSYYSNLEKRNSKQQKSYAVYSKQLAQHKQKIYVHTEETTRVIRKILKYLRKTCKISMFKSSFGIVSTIIIKSANSNQPYHYISTEKNLVRTYAAADRFTAERLLENGYTLQYFADIYLSNEADKILLGS